MNITRDVISDLPPAYLYGEVSADTHVLVEEFLEGDPDLAEFVVRCKKENVEKGEWLKGADMTLSSDHEMRTLSRTKACCNGGVGCSPWRWPSRSSPSRSPSTEVVSHG